MMNKVKLIILVLAFSLILFRTGIFTESNTEKPTRDKAETLKEILEKTALYCDKLEQYSLYYYCKEKVEETVYPIPVKYRGYIKTDIGIQGEFSKFRNKAFIHNVYVYDYQIVGKKNREKDRRILLRENGKKKHRKSSLGTHVFNFQKLVFTPMIFKKKEQKFYHFEIVDHKTENGKEIYVIKASPKPKAGKTLFWGKFWVEGKHFSIYKIEMAQGAITNFGTLIRKAQIMDAYPNILSVIEFNLERDGIRYPTAFSLSEDYKKRSGELLHLSKMQVDYYDYRFFNIDVNVKENPIKK